MCGLHEGNEKYNKFLVGNDCGKSHFRDLGRVGG